MRKNFCLNVLIVNLLFAVTVFAQSTQPVAATRDAKALSILSQCLKAGGGEEVFSKIKDFDATGNITYFWGGSEVSGPATIQGRGTEDFRLDARLKGGLRSIAVSKNSGRITELNGRSSDIPHQSRVNLSALSLPFLSILKAVQDPSISVYLIGEVEVEGRHAYQIRTQSNFSSSDASSNILSELSKKDFLVDASSFLPIASQWMAHPSNDYRQAFPQEVTFGDFRLVDGAQLPFSISEKISGQKTWVFRATAINLNQSLPEGLFSR